jgi:hypothetical protein
VSAASRRISPLNVGEISYSASREDLYGGCKRTGLAGESAALIKRRSPVRLSPLRAVRQSSYPFELGHSRALTVRVG